MSDSVAALPAPALKPGSETSENKLSRFVGYVAAGVSAAGTVLAAMSQAGIGPAWVGPALIVVGLATKLLESAGYRSSRTELKVAQIEAATAAAKAASAQVNDQEAAAKVLKDLLEASK